MKYILGTLYILIGLVLWLIIMIPSFILRCSWDFNYKNYNFKFQWYDYTKHECPLAIYSMYSHDTYTYNSYFHYLFNIKKVKKWKW